MAMKKTHKVHHRRRREGKTDYRLRFKTIKSKNLRFVTRKSSNNIYIQIIKYDSKGDKTLVSASSLELKKLGWHGNTGNIPSAYLTGLLCGKKAMGANCKRVVLDIGLFPSIQGSRLYAALKGGLDAGLEIPHSEGILPSEERIKGMHISNYASKLKKESPETYKKSFSFYIKNKSSPEDLPSNFEEVRKKILGEKAGKNAEKKEAKPTKETKAEKPKEKKTEKEKTKPKKIKKTTAP